MEGIVGRNCGSATDGSWGCWTLGKLAERKAAARRAHSKCCRALARPSRTSRQRLECARLAAAVFRTRCCALCRVYRRDFSGGLERKKALGPCGRSASETCKNRLL